MASLTSTICRLRETLQPGEVLPLMGLTSLQVQTAMNRLLETFQPTAEANERWTTASEQYNQSNKGFKNYTNQLGSSQHIRDLDLLMKRFEIFKNAILKGLFKPGTLDFHYIPAEHPEWKQNRVKSCLDGYMVTNRIVCDTTPKTFKATVVVFEKPRIRCNDTRMKVTTGNLLHEMVHAILEAYSCACQRCETNLLEGEGLTGHGRAWMAVARDVEKTVLRVFGYRCWLGRSQSLAHEHHAAKHRHTEKELRLLEVNERLYCEARMDFAQDEFPIGVAFDSGEFDENVDGVEDFEGLESDYSEDDEVGDESLEPRKDVV